MPFQRGQPSPIISPHSQGADFSEDQLAELVLSCHYDPLKFVQIAYPWGEKGPLQKYDGPDTWQEDFLIEWGETLRKNNFDGYTPVPPVRMTRSSGHGCGKTVLCAMITGFIMSTRPNCRGSVTANTYGQLETKTWATIQRWHKILICNHWFSITGSRFWQNDNRESWFTEPLSCAEENSEAFAGQHAAESTSFYIFDEGSNVPDKIYEVAEGGTTDGEAMLFVFGNPTRSSGKFFRINFGGDRNRWNHKAIDSRTCRYTNHPLLKEWEEDWGEDSDRFRVRVKGLPPSASDLQFISTSLVTAAKQRPPTYLKNDPVIAGLDIARGGDDNVVIRFRKGRDAASIPPIILPGQMVRDSTLLESLVIDILKNGAPLRLSDAKESTYNPESTGPRSNRVHIDMLFADGTGVGGPICDHLKAMGYRDRVVEIQFGAEAPNTAGFQECANMRSWMWEGMRAWLATGSIDASTDLESDLVAPMFHYRPSDNALILESKEAIKKRLGGSPDNGDALALTFARPVMPLKSDSQLRAEEEAGDVDWETGGLHKGRVWG